MNTHASAHETSVHTPAFSNTYDLLKNSAATFGDAPALSFMLQAQKPFTLQTFSYTSLFAKVNQTANFFNRLGADKNTVIALVMPNLAQTHFCLWGGEATGVVMPVNPLLESDALIGLLKEARASILVTLAPFPNVDLWQKVEQTLPHLPDLKHVALVNIAEQIAGIKGAAAKLIQKKHEFGLYGLSGLASALPSHINVHRFDNSIAKENDTGLDSKRVFFGDDKSSFFCTGGTTGLPKIAMRSHANEVANSQQILAMFGDNMIRPGKTVLCGLPLFHVNAVLATGLYPFMMGAHVLLATPQGFRGDGMFPNFWDIVETHRVNFFAAVPTVYSVLLNHSSEGRDISSLEFGICGAAPMPVQVIKDFEALSGIKILEGYGLTEATSVSSVNPPEGERKVGSIGLPLPSQKIEVVKLHDDQSGKFDVCAAGEKGILAINGDNVFSGYKLPEQNDGLWLTDQEGKRWLNTGDLGYKDEDGYLFLTGREKEMIIRGGHNIDAKSIEEVMYTHSAVAFAAAIGKPDAHSGELPIVYVQLKEGASATEQSLMAHAQEHITERAAIPKEVHIIDAMPLTTVGKVYKPDLKSKAIVASLNHLFDEAGIVASVAVNSHRIYGLETTITLEDKNQADAANKLLGALTLRYFVV